MNQKMIRCTLCILAFSSIGSLKVLQTVRPFGEPLQDLSKAPKKAFKGPYEQLEGHYKPLQRGLIRTFERPHKALKRSYETL